MSWHIRQEGGAVLVVLDSEMGIRNAADFHQAVLPLADTPGAVRVDAGATRSVHSSILQILFSLSKSIPDFGVERASAEFDAAEGRVGIAFVRINETETACNRP